MTALGISHLWKEYGDQIVLEDVSIDIAPRSFVALVGPSGCGKTTFLRLLLGQETPTRGRILIDGQPLPPEPGPDRGVVYQRYSVFPHLTVLGNVMLGPEMRASRFLGRRFGAARRALADEAHAMLAEVGLAGSEQKYPAQLSGGMQQRLALAQTLTMRPAAASGADLARGHDPLGRGGRASVGHAAERRTDRTGWRSSGGDADGAGLPALRLVRDGAPQAGNDHGPRP